MAKRTTKKKVTKKPIESYDHKGKKRANNPPVGLVTPETDPDAGQKTTYEYDPHLDPQLVWAGKAEHTSFQVPTVSLHVHERIDPRTIIEAARRRNGDGHGPQMMLFEQPEQNPLLRDAIGLCKPDSGGTARFPVVRLLELPQTNRYGNVNGIAGALGDEHKPVEAQRGLLPLAQAA